MKTILFIITAFTSMTACESTKQHSDTSTPVVQTLEQANLSDKLKEKDVVVVDVRTPEEFKEYSLPNAINIPLAELLKTDEKGAYVWEDYINQDVKTNVFFSNGSIYSTRAWVICTRLKFKNN